MMTIGIGDFVIYLALALVFGFCFGGLTGMHEGIKSAQQDIRRLKRQMDGHRYQAGDIVEVEVPQGSTVYATISRVYHLLDGDHDYQLLLPGGNHSDIDEEDIIGRVSTRLTHLDDTRHYCSLDTSGSRQSGRPTGGARWPNSA